MTKYLTIIMLTLISVYAYMGMSIKWQARQVDYIEKAITNQHEPPYKYRVIVPAACWLVNKATHSHLVTQLLLSLVIFGGMFTLVHNWFNRRLIPSRTATLMFGALVPVSITPFWVLDDYVTVIIFAAAMPLIADRKYYWFGLLLFLGMLIREQVIFLVPLFWILTQRKYGPEHWHGPNRWRATQLAAVYIILCLGAYSLPRLIFGYEPSRYTWAHHIHNNVSHLTTILPLWLAFIVPIIASAVILAKRYKRNGEQLGLLVIYTGLFIVSGNMWELAKYLPAMFLFVPLSLYGEWFK